jgi:hypothetical protein
MEERWQPRPSIHPRAQVLTLGLQVLGLQLTPDLSGEAVDPGDQEEMVGANMMLLRATERREMSMAKEKGRNISESRRAW